MEAAREAAAPRRGGRAGRRGRGPPRTWRPRVEAAQKAAQKALKDDVVPRLEAAQVAALAYATPRVVAAREAVTPALESARETLAAGVDSALSELDARRAELVAAAEKSTRKARKTAKKARKTAGKKRREFEKAARRDREEGQARVGVEKEPRRWPWVFVAFARGYRGVRPAAPQEGRRLDPAPAGDGPVPSYREDPVPSSPTAPPARPSPRPRRASDSAPAESDMGVRDAQLVDGDGPDDSTVNGSTRPSRSAPAAAPTRARRRAGRQAGLSASITSDAPVASVQRGRRASAGTVEIMSETAAPTPSSGSPLEPAGRKLLRLEVRNSQVPIERKPEWIKTRLKTGPEYTELKSLVRREGLHTVCEEAGCPNIYECWEDREATFLIGGDQCTRRCDFCQIDTGKPADFDADEPRRVAESVATMGLRYATITGVARDDLPDGGAWLYAETVRQIHAQLPGCGVELLIPDFNADPDQLAEVFSSRPEVLAHNVETVPRIFKRIRPGFRFDRSLAVITAAREAGLVTKSNLILGMGEEPHEVVETMQALHDAGCDLLTITQYLRPSPRHHPVVRWVKPDEFVGFQAEAERIGFPGVLAGPLVRSSYRAGRLYQQAIEARGLDPAGLTRGRSRRRARVAGGRPYPEGMARSKPTDATAPSGKAGRGPEGRGARPHVRARRPLGKAPEAGQERPAEGRPAEEARRPGPHDQAGLHADAQERPQAALDHADRFVAVAGVIELIGILLELARSSSSRWR